MKLGMVIAMFSSFYGCQGGHSRLERGGIGIERMPTEGPEGSDASQGSSESEGFGEGIDDSYFSANENTERSTAGRICRRSRLLFRELKPIEPGVFSLEGIRSFIVYDSKPTVLFRHSSTSPFMRTGQTNNTPIFRVDGTHAQISGGPVAERQITSFAISNDIKSDETYVLLSEFSFAGGSAEKKIDLSDGKYHDIIVYVFGDRSCSMTWASGRSNYDPKFHVSFSYRSGFTKSESFLNGTRLPILGHEVNFVLQDAVWIDGYGLSQPTNCTGVAQIHVVGVVPADACN